MVLRVIDDIYKSGNRTFLVAVSACSNGRDDVVVSDRSSWWWGWGW